MASSFLDSGVGWRECVLSSGTFGRLKGTHEARPVMVRHSLMASKRVASSSVAVRARSGPRSLECRRDRPQSNSTQGQCSCRDPGDLCPPFRCVWLLPHSRSKILTGDGFQTQKEEVLVPGQVRAEKVLADATTIDKRKEWTGSTDRQCRPQLGGGHHGEGTRQRDQEAEIKGLRAQVEQLRRRRERRRST